MDVTNPYTEKVFHQVGFADELDVNVAVLAAQRAFSTWKSTTGAERAVYLRKMSELVQKRKPLLSKLETMDTGKPYPESEWDMDDVAACFDYYADLAEKLDQQQDKAVSIPDDEFKATLRYEPVGPVAAIIPWNYPALMALWKIAPALAAGCTIVLKASELTPLTALELAAIAHEAQLPSGVLNVLTGDGVVTGAHLTAHPGIRKVAFTGSVATGKKIMHACAENITNISLELGGKSPAIVFDSADIERAVEWVMFGCFWTNGQICSATSRLLISSKIARKFLLRLQEETNKIQIGDPMDPKCRLGPLISKAQQLKVQQYISEAQLQGASVLCGGSTLPPTISQGFFVLPTVLTNVQSNMKVWQEEIFGPVLSVMEFSTEQEAIQLANASEYGLGSAVFSTCPKQLTRVTNALETGMVWQNCSQPCFTQLPWGGKKHSSLGGRELGTFGLHAYLEPKQVVSYVADKQFGWYFDSKL